MGDKIHSIIKKIIDGEHLKVKFAVTDIDGVLRGKVIHKDKFREVAEKHIGFCDVVFGWDITDKCYDNSKITGWHTGYPDAEAKLDFGTFRTIPWENSMPFFLGDFSSAKDGAIDICPRSLLKKVQSECHTMGFIPVFAQEFEWFNFIGTPSQLADSNYQNIQPISPGMFGYSILRPTLNNDFFNRIFDQMEAFGVPLEGLHTETGPGVYEAAIRHDEILNAADKAVLFKTGIKEIAYKHGIIASFMAKWNTGLPGCSGHIHQSLWDTKTNKNVFHTDHPHQMNELLENYVAGLLYCLPEVLPMYAPSVNSYKRLREGAWAPTNVTWGYDNRTTAVRILKNDEKLTRIEMRVPGSDSNPYLSMAASLASGLYGIKNNLKLQVKETVGNAYANNNNKKLPSNLREASKNMQDSALAKELFGQKFVEHFTATRDWEWREYSKAVTDWEIKRYFEII